MRKIFLFIMLAFIVFSSVAQTEKVTSGHFVIKYDKDVETYALASARILNFVWDRSEELGFYPPKEVKFNLIKSDRDVIFVDRNKLMITLEYTDINIAKSGKNHVYGFCHEMGHLCMFNITPNKNNWMTKEYREGWAEYFGERMIALLYEKYGINVWPDPYDYLALSVEYATTRTQAIEKGKDIPGYFISGFFWERLVNEKGMDKIPAFFGQIRSNRVRNPNATKKFRTELVKFGITNDLLAYFDQNEKCFIWSE